MNLSRNCAVALMAAVLVSGCRASNDSSSRNESAAAAARAGSLEGQTSSDTGRAAGMAGMQGMQGMMSGRMMDSMQAHMRMMDGMTGEQMKAMLATHRQMVANMLSQMNSEMRRMNMSGDPAWSATVDSVRQDLVHMPEMNGQQLQGMMPAHHARVTRLLEMHQRMMGQGSGRRQ